MQWLIRARLVLVQNNLGLAQVDLLAARRVLVALQVELSTEQAEQAAQIAQVVARLDAALGYLPTAPVAAADELEGAWQLLVADMAPAPAGIASEDVRPEATPEVDATAAPEAEATPSATPETGLTATPTSEASPTPTPQS